MSDKETKWRAWGIVYAGDIADDMFCFGTKRNAKFTLRPLERGERLSEFEITLLAKKSP